MAVEQLAKNMLKTLRASSFVVRLLEAVVWVSGELGFETCN